MSIFWQVYYNAVFGAMGGLAAWLVLGSVPTGTWYVHLANAFVGGGVGFFIGGAIGAVDGMVIKRSVMPTITGSAGGCLAGIVGGAVGLFLGGVTFVLLGGGLIPRMLGWMALGLFLGVGQGVISLKFKRAAYGLVGGTLAGVVGGAFYEALTQAFLQQSGEAQVFLSALGLILIGACLGSIIPLSREILRRVGGDTGMVIVLNGRRADMEKEIIGSITLGSSDASDVYLPDEGIEHKQAVISKGLGGFVIQNVGAQRPLTAGQRTVGPQSSAPLNNGDIITISETRLRFKAK